MNNNNNNNNNNKNDQNYGKNSTNLYLSFKHILWSLFLSILCSINRWLQSFSYKGTFELGFEQQQQQQQQKRKNFPHFCCCCNSFNFAHWFGILCIAFFRFFVLVWFWYIIFIIDRIFNWCERMWLRWRWWWCQKKNEATK